MGSKFLERHTLAAEEYQNTNYYNTTLSTEMIAYQKNDYVVNALVEQFTELVETIKDIMPMDNTSIFRSSRCLTIIDRIDAIIRERFGITVKHLKCDGIGYAVYPVPPKNYNVLFGDVVEIYEAVKEATEEYDGRVRDKDSMRSADSEKNFIDMHTTIVDNIHKLDKHMYGNNIKIDLQRAKITNLPNDYFVYLNVDLFLLVVDIGMNPRELTAALLHEVGHAFTHIEYSYRGIHNTSVLLDTFLDNFRDKNKPFKESLLIAYKATDPSINLDKLGDKNTVAVALAVFNGFIKENTYFAGSKHSFTDSEQLADNFAGRFGMGPDLVSGLAKLHKLVKIQGITISIVASIICIITVFMFIFAAGIMATGIGFILITGSLMGLLAIYNTLYITDDGVHEAVYDNNKQRYSRIKYEMIRMIRSTEMPKDAIASSIKAIEEMDRLIASAPNPRAGMINWIYTHFFSNGRKLAEFKQIEQFTEKLMENDLYVAANKLKMNI